MASRVRPSAIAGSWYPGSPRELLKTIQTYLDSVPPLATNQEITGIISPHAGYAYSGQVAAHAYRCLQGLQFDTVIILSPMHRMPFSLYHVSNADYYETPLGRIPVNRDLVKKITANLNCSEVENDQEHSLEIQLPFLQVVLDDFDLVPIMIGHSQVYEVSDLVEAILPVCKEMKTLVIASSDLHHIADYKAVVDADQRVVDALSTLNLNEVRQVLARADSSVCGRAAISALLELSMKLGLSHLDVLDHRNSGDITGNQGSGEYTVGYMSAVISK
ncbi:AmmeMemoRadiSam system protein B [candidate division KSB1 bacterium]|nr:AmmeMemoRadiSam system protein B [candidate division KSB1 bacterium]